MLNEVQRPSQLAAVAARASANGTTSVMFTVRMSHRRGFRPAAEGQPRAEGNSDVPSRQETDEAVLETVMAREELLFFSCGEIEFHVTTRGTTDRKLSDSPVEAELRESDIDHAVEIEGRTTLNPGFLYETAHQLEVMFVYGGRPWAPTVSQAKVTTQLARDIADLVVNEAKAPILFMHLPAAPYREPSGHERGDGSKEALRDPHALCLRMSLALVGDQTEARLRFLERLGRKANEWGVGLHIGDRRPGKIRGEWITVRPFDPDLFQLRMEEELSEVVSDVVERGQPVTIVGPARVGSSLAIFQTLTAHDVGIVGLSVTAMQEMAFINFVAVERNGRSGSGPGTYRLREGLSEIIRSCGHGSVDMLSTADVAPATDYQVLIGPSQPIVVDTEEQARPRPLWMTWDVPFGEVDLDDVLMLLTESLQQQSVGHVLEYGRARLAGDGRVRGRAKVSVRLTDPRFRAAGPREGLRQLCTVIEDNIRVGVANRAHLNESEVRIRVMWRERWLGSWDYPL
jgi:hypothetical protein